MSRKVIQIACQGPAVSDEGQYIPVLYALCDDGSIWQMKRFDHAKWERVASVPWTGKEK